VKSLNASRLIAGIKIKDVFLSPATYILLTISLLTAYVYIQGFVRTIEGDGINLALHPLYTMTGKFLTGLLGEEFLKRLLASGPGLLTTFTAPLPFLLFILIHSVLSRGLDRENRVVELIAYGPSNETAYNIASLITDLCLAGLMIVSLTLFSLTVLVSFNLAVRIHFVANYLLQFFMLFSLSALGIFLSTMMKNALSALFSYSTVLLGLVVLEVLFYSVTADTVRSILLPFHLILRWISPFYYFRLGAVPFSSSGTLGLFFSILGNTALGALFLFSASLTAKKKGVRG